VIHSESVIDDDDAVCSYLFDYFLFSNLLTGRFDSRFYRAAWNAIAN